VQLVIIFLVLFMFSLASCTPSNPPGPAIATQPPAPQSSQAAIPATGNLPSVTVNNQNSDGASVMVAKVVSQGPGWIAIHNSSNGQVGPVIGYSPVKDGENDNVVVKLDPNQVTPTLYAMLHYDRGIVGKYEFPGPDVPVLLNGQMVSPAFQITVTQAPSIKPAITIHDQDVSGGKVLVDQVISDGPGWVDVHIQNPDGSQGEAIGYSAVKSGTNNNVVIVIDARKATPVMYAMLHIDSSVSGQYTNPSPGVAVMLNGEMVMVPFKTGVSGTAKATLNPTGQATSMVGMNMGSTASAATPGPTVASGMGGMVIVTPSGGITPTVKVSDQPVQNGIVKVDDVVSNGPGWIVIYTMANEQPDQAIGYTHVNDGDNPNVNVKVDQSKVTPTLWAQLHIDAGTPGVFEFPGPDAPVMIGVQMISGVFKTGGATTTAVASTATPNPVPSITISDQPIHDGTVVVSNVVSVGDEWVVIHPMNPDGSMGEFIGYAPVHNGVTKNLLVKINTSRSTPILFAMLHMNASHASVPQFPGADTPVYVNGRMVAPSFHITGSLGGDVPLTTAKNSSAGVYLTDGYGMSLYLDINDKPGASSCNSDCQVTWHPLLATGAILPRAGVAVDKIGVLLLPDGSRQVTYGGQPLYYFNGDQNPGDINGQGKNGVFFLVTP
jgi:predicted lipoprotein with Yx(FWY)xxD motif